MMEQVQNVQEKTTSAIEPVVGFGRKTVCLGVGTAGLAADKVKELWNKGGEFSDRAIERGEGITHDARVRVVELAKEPQTFAKDNVKKISDAFDKYTNRVLHRADQATATDIEVVSEKVAKVEKKVEKAAQKPAVKSAKKEVKAVVEAVDENVVKPLQEVAIPETI
jgi:polyhydroxyalkanoate synthesis regulator phasin